MVLRRVEVPLTIRLDRLHLVLQAAMGWTNSHLYEIRARDVGWGMPDPDWGGGPLDARKARLVDVVEDTGAKTLKYLYDFGDGWEHTVKIERITEAVPGLTYECVDGQFRRPARAAVRVARRPLALGHDAPAVGLRDRDVEGDQRAPDRRTGRLSARGLRQL